MTLKVTWIFLLLSTTQFLNTPPLNNKTAQLHLSLPVWKYHNQQKAPLVIGVTPFTWICGFGKWRKESFYFSVTSQTKILPFVHLFVEKTCSFISTLSLLNHQTKFHPRFFITKNFFRLLLFFHLLWARVLCFLAEWTLDLIVSLASLVVLLVTRPQRQVVS